MTTISAMIGSPGAEYFVNGNTYQANGQGLITGYTNSTGSFSGIAGGDVVGLINNGAIPATSRQRHYNAGAVRVASATGIVANTAAINATLTIAAQPDVPRQLAAVLAPGAAAITAGTLTMTYVAPDGTTQSDAFSLVTGSGVSQTFTTSKGVTSLTSAVISGIAGGSSPTIQVGTNNVLALPKDANNGTITVNLSNLDGSAAALPTQSGADGHLVTPGTAPNSTHTYAFGYSFFSG